MHPCSHRLISFLIRVLTTVCLVFFCMSLSLLLHACTILFPLIQGTDVPSYRAGGMVLHTKTDEAYGFGLNDGDGHVMQ